MLLLYTVGLSFVALMRFYTFRTYIDLGVFNQAFSSTLHGHLFYETPDLAIIPSGNFLGTHFAPLLFLLLPFYALHPGPETLLILQTPFIALGAVPIYLIARQLLEDERLCLYVAAIYLVNPAVLSLNLFDFHLEAFLPFFLGMSFYFLMTKRWKPYSLFLGLSLITIEFASFIAAAMAVSILISERRKIRSLFSRPRYLVSIENRSILVSMFTIIAALGWFYFAIYMSSIFAGTGAPPAKLLGGFLPSFQEWIGASLQSKLLYWSILLGTLLFVPLKAVSRAIIAAPWLLVTAITANGVYYALGYQYAGAFVAPYLIIALVYALHTVGPSLRVHETRVMLFGGIFLLSLMFTPLAPWTQHNLVGITYEEGLPIPTSHDATIYQIMNLIPSNASILTQNNLFSHFSDRPDAYLYLPNNGTMVDYIFADNMSRWYTSRTFGQEPLAQVVSVVLSNHSYVPVAEQDGVILLERNV
jgi:uncharacterized membrane protein